jgi:hypothetical protein
MANLTATTATSFTINGGTVWTSGNSRPSSGTTIWDGTSEGLDARQLNGYDIRYFAVRNNTESFTVGGNSSTFYPIVFRGQSWGGNSNGRTVWMHLNRTPNQDGTNYGSLNARIRYRSTNWGYHRNFWEIDENWGSGNFYPFIARAVSSPHRVYTAVWLRGGNLSYTVAYSDPEFVFDGRAVDAKGGPGVAGDDSTWSWISRNNTTQIFSQTAVQVPSNAWYLQTHLCSRGYNLGDASFRWSNCYVNSKDISSDVKLKSNFSVSFGPEFLDKLTPRSYTRNDLPNEKIKKRHHGFIAQEVQEVLKELGIAEDDFAGFDGRNPDHLALSYDQFLPAIINTIKDEEEKTNELKSRLRKLEEKYGLV